MRYPYLKSEDMTARQREVAEAIDRRGIGGFSGPYTALIYSPEVADRVQPLADYLRVNLRLPERLRVLAILIAARHKNADMDYFARVENARSLGLSDETIKMLAQGRRPDNLAEDEALIFDYCLELLKTGGVKDLNFNRVVERFGHEIALELVAVCGYTALLAVLLNVAETPLTV